VGDVVIDWRLAAGDRRPAASTDNFAPKTPRSVGTTSGGFESGRSAVGRLVEAADGPRRVVSARDKCDVVRS
jgi:hypothetical protein